MWQLREVWHHRHQHLLTIISTSVALILVLTVELCSSVLKDGMVRIIDDLGMNVTMVEVMDEHPVAEDWLNEFVSCFPVKEISHMYYLEEENGITVFCDEKLSNLLPMTVRRGRFISESDMSFNDSVAVLGHEIWRQLDCPDIGDEIMHFGISYEVIGILSDSEGSLYLDSNNTIFMPTGYSILRNECRSRCFFRHEGGYPRYYLDQILGKDNYLLADQQEVSQALKGMVDLAGRTARLLSLICLAVALMGLMNNTLAAIQRRNHEIGIKKALGATDLDIIRQFILETLTVIGVALMVSVMVMIVLVLVLKAIVSETITIHYEECLTVIIRILTAGIIMGLYPAYKASKITIMQAIRTDNRD